MNHAPMACELAPQTLSPLTLELFAAILTRRPDPKHSQGYVAGWNLTDPRFAGIDSTRGSPADEAKRDLLACGLIDKVPHLGCRYQPTARVWQTMLARVQTDLAAYEATLSASDRGVRGVRDDGA